jgi:enamine deaminase RidA (YjgF/YER057c/UK114 family)
MESTSGLRHIEKSLSCQDGLTISYTDAGAAGLFVAATVTGQLRGGSSVRRLYEAVATILAEKDAVLVHERVFASLSSANDLLSSRRLSCEVVGIDSNTPFTLVQGRPPWGEGVAGSLFYAVPASVACPETLFIGATPVGRRWSTANNDYLMLQLSGNASLSKDLQIQTVGLFDVAAELLVGQGFQFSDVARTWFYIRDILEHYHAFNLARDRMYTHYGLMLKPPARVRLPASTGIGCVPANGAALAGNFLALKCKSENAFRCLSNPAQKEAFEYGAAFSRAALIQEQEADLIQVSGTASIGEDGKTLYPGNGASQIACTLDKLEALLETASAHLYQVATANVFVRYPALIDTFKQIAKERGLSVFPVVPVIADICRDDLLFEIDAEVVVPKTGTIK